MKNASYKMGLALALSVFAVSNVSAQKAERGQRQQNAQQQGDVRRGGRGGPQGLLLRGITLSADQKARLQTLRAEQRKEFEKSRPQGEAKAKRQRPDSTVVAARRAEMEKRREQQFASLRSILTADQQVQFDKNVAELKANAGKGGLGKGREGRPGREGRRFGAKR
jgi:hypothetical protein